MSLTLNRFLALAAFSVCLAVSSPGEASDVEASEKTLDLTNVINTCYALGGDVTNKKAFEEGIYLSKGKPDHALVALKGIIFEGEKPISSFRMNDQIDITVFRGSFLKLSKVEIKKVLLKDSNIEIYAEYKDFPDCDIASQPAAVIPIGQLPPDKYSVSLFVGDKLRNKAEFSVHK